MSGNVYRIVLDGEQIESEHGFTFELGGDAIPVAVAGHSEAGDTLEILPLHQDCSQDVTYIQVGDTEGVMYHNRAVELLLEYGPDWRTDMLHDIHTSCSDMFQYPVFCRDGVFWSCKLLLAAVSQMMSVAISTSDPESCLVIPDLSRHDLQGFYENAFRGFSEDRVTSAMRVAATFAVEGLILEDGKKGKSSDEYEIDEDEEEEEIVPEIFGCLKKSDKIKLSEYFGHSSENDRSFDGFSKIDFHLSLFKEQKFQCNECSRKFSDNYQLERHHKLVHSQKEKSDVFKPHKCPHCDRRFTFASNVGRHVFLLHTQEKYNPSPKESIQKSPNSNSKLEKLEDIKCKVCNVYFPNWKKLQLHMFDHTSERPFNCEKCGRGFKEESKLKRHSLIHSGLKPFSCQFCKKSFSLKQNRDIHERLHTGSGFSCSYCQEIFSQKVNLRKHESKHEMMEHIKSMDPKVREDQTTIKGRKACKNKQ